MAGKKTAAKETGKSSKKATTEKKPAAKAAGKKATTAKEKPASKAAAEKKPAGKPAEKKADAKPAEQKPAPKRTDLVEQAWRDSMVNLLTNGQKLDIASEFKHGRPVNVRGLVHVQGNRLPFHTILRPPAPKKKKK